MRIFFCVFILLLSSCQQRKQADAIVRAPHTVEEIGAYQPQEETTSSAEEFSAVEVSLKEFLKEKKSIQDHFPKFIYEASEELHTISQLYCFEEDRLRLVHEELAEEGGGGFQLSIVLSFANGISEKIVKTSYFDKGYFSDPLLGDFLLSPGVEELSIIGYSENENYEYETEMLEHINTMKKHRDQFELINGQYVFYKSRAIVKGQYGEIETYKKYTIDSSLYLTRINH